MARFNADEAFVIRALVVCAFVCGFAAGVLLMAVQS
jgi:hypothetical protein